MVFPKNVLKLFVRVVCLIVRREMKALNSACNLENLAFLLRLILLTVIIFCVAENMQSF